MKKLILILFAVIVGCSSPPDTNLTAVQRFFDLDESLQIVEMLSYLDGGTIGLKLVDIHGNKSDLCIDNEGFGILIPKEEKGLPETLEFIDRLKHTCIYVGATHPDNDGAEKIEYQSDLESSVMERIKLLMSQNIEFEDEFYRFISATHSERDLSVIYE
jgi:hypothetical protein